MSCNLNSGPEVSFFLNGRPKGGHLQCSNILHYPLISCPHFFPVFIAEKCQKNQPDCCLFRYDHQGSSSSVYFRVSIVKILFVIRKGVMKVSTVNDVLKIISSFQLRIYTLNRKCLKRVFVKIIYMDPTVIGLAVVGINS